MLEVDGNTLTFSFKYRIFELHPGDKFMEREYEPGWYVQIVWEPHKSELYGPIATESLAAMVIDDQKKMMALRTKTALGHLQARLGSETDGG
jgi:hypothetical protein